MRRAESPGEIEQTGCCTGGHGFGATPSRSPRPPRGDPETRSPDAGGGRTVIVDGRPSAGASTAARPRPVHTVDWVTLQAIRTELLRRADQAASCAVASAYTSERLATAEELVHCWLDVAEAHQLRQGLGPLTGRDREFIDIRVSQSMREVDPQCTGMVDIDLWVHHMLLTRSSPPAMRAMLQINRLMEASLSLCPGILVSLQHGFEVAREVAATSAAQDGNGVIPGAPEANRVDSAPGGGGASSSSSKSSASTRLPVSEVVSIYGRKLWHLRPGTKESPAKRKTDFSYRTPDEFVQSTVKALELDRSAHISAADFLALCLGRREWEVTLHLYDLSHGVAAALSPWLLPEQLEGVWHTGLVVYGKEYYFGGDIYYDTPGETGFGRPRIAISMGSTLRQRDELHSFVVDELKPIFTREAYDAARNNCNHFTDRVSMFLVGRHIPEEVLRQPELMLHTSLGRTLRPVLTRILGQYFEPKGTAEEISSAHGLSGRWPGPTVKRGAPEGSGEPHGDALWEATFSL